MLYHLIHSPFEQSALMQCLERLRPGQDQLLLSRDAVIAAAAPYWQAQLAALRVPVYVLAEDLAARGLNAGVGEVIDMAGFVDLVAQLGNPLLWG